MKQISQDENLNLLSTRLKDADGWEKLPDLTKLIVKAMDKYRWTQNVDLARASGVSPVKITRLLQGASISLDDMFRILMATDLLRNPATEIRPTVSIQNVSRLKVLGDGVDFSSGVPVVTVSDTAAWKNPDMLKPSDITGVVIWPATKRWMRGNPENCTALTVPDDSMLPAASKGDLVIVEHGIDPEKIHGRLCAVRHEEKMFVRRIVKKGALLGVPENKLLSDFNDQILSLTEKNIIGVVIGWISSAF